MAWLAPLLVLGLVILVHELGHFWAAKIFGVYAPRFAIGFGPALWRKRWGETEYVIGVLPLGGYVRMATRDDEATVAIEGELDESKGTKKEPLDPGAMIPFGPNPVPANRWFESKPLWQRAIILLAGVTMNVVLTVVVAIGIFAAYGRPYLRPVVASVVAGKPAAKAGVKHDLRDAFLIPAFISTVSLRFCSNVRFSPIPACPRFGPKAITLRYC